MRVATRFEACKTPVIEERPAALHPELDDAEVKKFLRELREPSGLTPCKSLV
jgi:hypothetical protein